MNLDYTELHNVEQDWAVETPILNEIKQLILAQGPISEIHMTAEQYEALVMEVGWLTEQEVESVPTVFGAKVVVMEDA